MNNSSLPTLFYFFYDRKNWEYAYKCPTGKWILRRHISLPEVIRRFSNALEFEYSFRARPLGKTKFFPPLLLNLFYNRLSGREDS